MDLLQRTLPMHLREGGLRSKDSYALQMGCQRSNAMAPPQLPLKRDHGLWISHHCCSCWGREGWGGRVRGGYAHDAWRWTLWYGYRLTVLWELRSCNRSPHCGNIRMGWNLSEVELTRRSLSLWVIPLKMLRYFFRGHLLGLMEISL